MLLLNNYKLKKNINNKFVILILLIIIYIFLSFIGCLYSSEKYQSVKEMIILSYYLFALLISIFSVNLINENKKNQILKNIGIISYSILILMVILQFFNIAIFNELIIVNNVKYFSPFSDYNIFIYSFLISICLILSNIQNNKYYFIFYFLNFLIAVIFVFLSGSRRSIFYLLIYLFFFSKFITIKKLKLLVYLLIISIIIFMILFYFCDIEIDAGLNNNYNNIYISKINRIISFLFGESKISGERVYRWIKSINIIRRFDFSQSIMGLGTRSYYTLPEFIRPNGGRDYPHNFILSAFIEGGISKTVLVLIIALYPLINLMYKKDFNNEKKRSSVIFLYLLWLIQVFISGDEFFNSKQIFLLYFIIFIYNKSYYRTRTNYVT